MSKEETAVVATGGGAVAQYEGASRGFENVKLESVTMPTAKVLQPISKEVADEAYSDYNFKAGNIIHSLLLEKLSDTFVPLIMNDNKICFVPKKDTDKDELKRRVLEKFGVTLTDEDFKGAFVCRSDDNINGTRFGACASCGMCEFDGAKAPLCNKNVNVLALFDDQPLPVVIRFSSTSHKHGKAFKNLAFFAGGDLFSRKYKLITEKKTDKGNTWYEVKAQPAGKLAKDDEKYQIAESMYNQFKNVMILTEDESEHAGAAESAATGEF